MRVTLDIFADLLPHAGIAELEQGDGADDEEDDDRDGGRKAVVDTATAGEGEVIHVTDQDICVPGRGRGPGDGRATRVEEIDQIKIIKVEGKRGD